MMAGVYRCYLDRCIAADAAHFTRSGEGADFYLALFTATSATCVTGLVVEDTYLFWSPFGCTVIILLIQTGGLGL